MALKSVLGSYEALPLILLDDKTRGLPDRIVISIGLLLVLGSYEVLPLILLDDKTRGLPARIVISTGLLEGLLKGCARIAGGLLQERLRIDQGLPKDYLMIL